MNRSKPFTNLSVQLDTLAPEVKAAPTFPLLKHGSAFHIYVILKIIINNLIILFGIFHAPTTCLHCFSGHPNRLWWC
jgi:hypothetical protein